MLWPTFATWSACNLCVLLLNNRNDSQWNVNGKNFYWLCYSTGTNDTSNDSSLTVLAPQNERVGTIEFSINFDYFFRLIRTSNTAQKKKFSIKDFFSKCDQMRRKLGIWSHILTKSSMENFIFCVVQVTTHSFLPTTATPDSSVKYNT